MYAVISDRGNQETVRVGDVVRLDFKADADTGQELTFDQVLLVSNEGEVRVGAPLLDGVKVTAEVLGSVKGKKEVIFRFKRRKNVRVKRGHRQKYTDVRITGISA